MASKEVGLRERTRRAVQAELMFVAVDLFLAQGFEATTVDQIADAAGVSRRSFFRYFASKDDVLTQTFANMGTEMATQLQSQPAGDPPWVSLRAVFEGQVISMMSDQRAYLMTRLMLQNPALHASHLQKQTTWLEAIVPVLAARLPSTAGDLERTLQADALTRAALACLLSAQTQWVALEAQQPLGPLVDQAMNAVSPLATDPHHHIARP